MCPDSANKALGAAEGVRVSASVQGSSEPTRPHLDNSMRLGGTPTERGQQDFFFPFLAPSTQIHEQSISTSLSLMQLGAPFLASPPCVLLGGTVVQTGRF